MSKMVDSGGRGNSVEYYFEINVKQFVDILKQVSPFSSFAAQSQSPLCFLVDKSGMSIVNYTSQTYMKVPLPVENLRGFDVALQATDDLQEPDDRRFVFAVSFQDFVRHVNVLDKKRTVTVSFFETFLNVGILGQKRRNEISRVSNFVLVPPPKTVKIGETSLAGLNNVLRQLEKLSAGQSASFKGYEGVTLLFSVDDSDISDGGFAAVKEPALHLFGAKRGLICYDRLRWVPDDSVNVNQLLNEGKNAGSHETIVLDKTFISTVGSVKEENDDVQCDLLFNRENNSFGYYYDGKTFLSIFSTIKKTFTKQSLEYLGAIPPVVTVDGGNNVGSGASASGRESVRLVVSNKDVVQAFKELHVAMMDDSTNHVLGVEVTGESVLFRTANFRHTIELPLYDRENGEHIVVSKNSDAGNNGGDINDNNGDGDGSDDSSSAVTVLTREHQYRWFSDDILAIPKIVDTKFLALHLPVLDKKESLKSAPTAGVYVTSLPEDSSCKRMFIINVGAHEEYYNHIADKK